MQHDEFIGQVQHRARLDSRGAAEAATRATLETLGERLEGGTPSNIAGQLPHEIQQHLAKHDGPAERFEVGDFYARVADRESPGTHLPDAALHARAVLSVVGDAVGDGTLEQVKEQLTPDYTDLLDFSELRAG